MSTGPQAGQHATAGGGGRRAGGFMGGGAVGFVGGGAPGFGNLGFGGMQQDPGQVYQLSPDDYVTACVPIHGLTPVPGPE